MKQYKGIYLMTIFAIAGNLFTSCYLQSPAISNSGEYLYPFVSNDKWGYINSEGKVVIQPKYDYAYDFVNGIGQIDIDNVSVMYVDVNGRCIAKGVNTALDQKIFVLSEGLLAVCDPKTQKYGFVDKKGKWIIKPKFFNVNDFSDGLAAVWENADMHVDTGSDCGTAVLHSKWGYIDKTGQYVIQPKYYEVSNFNNGLAWSDDKIIDKKEIQISLNHVNDTKILFGGLMFYDSILSYVVTNWVSGFDDTYLHGYIKYLNQRTDKYGFKNWNGDIIIPPAYDNIQYFSENLASVQCENRKWGFIDSTGKTVIEPIYDDAGSFLDGLAPVKWKGKWGFINRDNNFVVQPIFDEVADYNTPSRFWGGRARMMYQNKMCYIDKQGKIIWMAP